MDLVDTLPIVRYWSVVLCCTILTHLRDLEVKVMDFCLSFWLKFFRSLPPGISPEFVDGSR